MASDQVNIFELVLWHVFRRTFWRDIDQDIRRNRKWRETLQPTLSIPLFFCIADHDGQLRPTLLEAAARQDLVLPGSARMPIGIVNDPMGPLVAIKLRDLVRLVLSATADNYLLDMSLDSLCELIREDPRRAICHAQKDAGTAGQESGLVRT